MRRTLIILSTVLSFSLMWSMKCNAEVCAFIPNSDNDSVSVIRVSDNTVIATFNTGDEPRGIDATSDGSHLYITNHGDDTVSVIRTSDYANVGTINVGKEPYDVSVTPDGSHAYVANRGDDTVSVIRTSDNTVIQTVTVGSEPYGIDVTPDGAFVYVANSGGATISVISTSGNSVNETIELGSDDQPNMLETTPDGRYAYVTLAAENVLVIRLSDNTIVATVPVGNAPKGLAVTPDNDHVYVSNSRDDTVSVIRISDNTVIRIVDVGSSPYGVDVTPDGNYVYAANLNDHTVSVIRTSDNSVVDSIPVGSYPYAYGAFIHDVEVVPDVVRPEAPSGLTVEALTSSQAIDLSWNDNSTNETGFKVERKVDSNGTYEEIGVGYYQRSANMTSYSDAGLEESVTYYYRVRSYNTAGNSGFSNEASATATESECFITTIGS